jgi:hypothetical protein
VLRFKKAVMKDRLKRKPKMGYAIFRIEKKKTRQQAAKMLDHALRETPVANALPDAPPPVVLYGSKTMAEGMATLKATIKQAKEKGGAQGFTKASTPALDMLVTTSHEDMQRMTLPEQNNYFQRALKFIAEKFGGLENILTAAIHRDETTAHMQVIVMPFNRTTNRFTAAQMIGGPVGLSKLQDGFWEACGEPHGLMRGEKGSKAKHVPVRVLYSQMANGQEPPKLIEVPPDLGMTERLKPGYADKKAANDAARATAMKHNENERKRLNDQAKRGRMMSPQLVAQQADKYRRNVALEKTLKAQQVTVQADKATAAKDRAVAAETLQRVKNATQELQVQARAADGAWTKSGAQMLDKWSKLMKPEMVTKAAKALGIELVPGRGLIDQMRKQGVGKSLQDCANRLDRVLDGAMSQHVSSGDAQRSIERHRG